MVEPDLTDRLIDFGAYKMGTGLAFEGEGQSGAQKLPVMKRYETIDGRPVLIEAVEYQSAKDLLSALPPGPAASRQARAQVRRTPLGAQRPLLARALRSKPAPAATVKPIQEARLREEARRDPTFVLDYSLVTGATNIIFTPDVTWFVSGNVYLYGTTRFLGGAVIKYTNSSVAPSLRLRGPVECDTDPLRPVIFTAQDDNTVGDILPWSTGNPTNYYANPALEIDSYSSGVVATNLKHLRFSYASIGVSFFTGFGHELSHAQFSRCGTALQTYYSDVAARNLLVVSSDRVFGGSVNTSTGRVEHLTADRIDTLTVGTVAFLTNSLLVNVTNAAYTGANNYSNTSSSVFASSAAGAHYLATNTYRDLGTTNISPALLADLKQRTTYAPALLTNKFIGSTNLAPLIARDTNAPDLGYSYPAVDYALSTFTITNGTLTIAPGTVLIAMNSSAVWLQDNTQLQCEGTPTQPIRFTRPFLVGEVSTNLMGLSGASVIFNPFHYGSSGPPASYRFVEFHTSGTMGYPMYIYGGNSSNS